MSPGSKNVGFPVSLPRLRGVHAFGPNQQEIYYTVTCNGPKMGALEK